MAWTNLTFTSNQVLTSAQLNNLQGNFGAMAAVDSGAPRLKLSESQNTSITSYYFITIPASGQVAYIPSGLFYACISSFSGIATDYPYFEMYMTYDAAWRGRDFTTTTLVLSNSSDYRFRSLVTANGQILLSKVG